MRLPDDHPSRSRTPSPVLLEHRSLVDTIDPSTLAGPSGSNGHLNGSPFSNRHVPPPSYARDVAKVTLAGTALYEGSHIDREEFVRLVIQSLRDVGYVESADVLEAESGYRLESAFVAAFREAIVGGHWDDAENAMDRLGALDEDDRRAAKFLISQQKYLELLEEQDLNTALVVLRTELAPLNVDSERLQVLSSLLMLASAEEVRRCAGWDGASGMSRQRLLLSLQHYIPSSVMIPSRRFDTLLEQAREYQRNSCLYHNSSTPFSLYTDHACSQDSFPNVTTLILAEHEDEVWDLKWSNDGCYLATASSDRTAIIWRIGPSISVTERECVPEQVLRNHSDIVNGLAWSPDDETLLTCADRVIKMWKTKTGVCMKDLSGHKDMVTAVEWLPDGSGFISAGMDSRIIFWDNQGKQRDVWENVPIRITDIATSPDGSRFIAVGISREPITVEAPPLVDQHETNGRPHPPIPDTQLFEKRIMVWNWTEGRLEASITLEDYGEVTSVKISRDSRFALIGHGPDASEVQLWDLDGPRMARKYTGHRLGKNVIRSCFGGADEHFIVSGSENGKVYIWQRGTGELIDALAGHGQGSVNCVAWNPRIPSMFASCSDDKTIRIWESPAPASIDGTQPKGKQRWDTDAGAVR
ncbi:WD40 repeat-like protein [Hysterangium stoloniferum]|nr:WD40 repeat-like protein [Hysterangium stoloniferum]